MALCDPYWGPGFGRAQITYRDDSRASQPSVKNCYVLEDNLLYGRPCQRAKYVGDSLGQSSD